MITNRNLNRWIGIGLCIICFCLLLAILYQPSIEVSTSLEVPLYETKLFNQNQVSIIDVQIEQSEWDEMIESALEENYVKCNLVINGETYYNVGIRAKGNSSLSQVASDPDTDRVSFKIKFDKYVKGQNYYGLDKFVLNNNFMDATSMKEYLSYEIMDYIGVVNPLHAYTQITVNGEPWGLYLAVEALEQSFAERNFGSDYGQLYKPETVGMGGGGKEGGGKMERPDGQEPIPGVQEMPEGSQGQMGNGPTIPAGGEGQMSNGPTIPEDSEGQMGNGPTIPAGGEGQESNAPTIPEDSEGQMGNTPTIPAGGEGQMNNRPTMPEGSQGQMMPSDFEGRPQGNGGFGGNGGGSDLVYSDDQVETYSSIFESAVFKTTSEDEERVITALRNLNDGTDLEQYINVESVLKYFAANTFVVNLDSYVSSMKHNYYLYEDNGQLSMLPWDYNLAFGGFQAGTASSAVNFPIDTPVSGVDLSERPIIGKLLEVEAYKEQYHTYLQQIVEEYIGSGLYAQTIKQVQNLISPYVKEDPTAFYTYDEYVEAVARLKQFGILRAESVKGQLNGTIPSTTETQKEKNHLLVDASLINLEVMGTQGGGMDKDGGGRLMGMPTDGSISNKINQSPVDQQKGGPMPNQIPAKSDASSLMINVVAMTALLGALVYVWAFKKRKR
ncbi:CotH kinase family protein [Niameybacter massiliensis]|uniref:CotH kinase family protein n=1 Tax=Niameybacter massiliensis TaxID=1658108 RepID=UPI0006B52E75|nr:CotH kinase family protein [Niameybacter massiliensis]